MFLSSIFTPKPPKGGLKVIIFFAPPWGGWGVKTPQIGDVGLYVLSLPDMQEDEGYNQYCGYKCNIP
jgi:hypothetical protein